MLDAGVHRTVAARWIYPELVRDPDWPYNAPPPAKVTHSGEVLKIVRFFDTPSRRSPSRS